MQEHDLYFIKRWGEGYFGVNDRGNVIVKPNRSGSGGDLLNLLKHLLHKM